MSIPAIHADRLTKHFRTATAVDDLNLQVHAGEVVGFLGPNGAGKTTTIRLLLGFLRPTAGRARLLDAAAGDIRVRRRIGYLPGDLRVDPALTGQELFSWYGRLRGRHDPRHVDELTERLHLDPHAPFGTLSKGNRQKVGIIQAMCHRPEVLLLDEPTSGLDPLIQREFLTLVAEAAEAGAAVLLSTHLLPEVERAASRVAIIRAGRLVTLATVDDLLDRARHRLDLRFADPVAATAFTGVDGVSAADIDGRTATLTIDGPLGPALRAAADAGTVLRVTPAGDDLEEMFVALYRPIDTPTGVH